MKFLLDIKRDFAYLFALLLVVLVSCNGANSFFKECEQYYIYEGTKTFGDLLMYFFQGEPVQEHVFTSMFNLPVYWFVYQLIIACVLAGTIRDNLDEHGKMIMIYCGSRKKYIHDKLKVANLKIFAIYVFIGMIVLGYSILNNYKLSMTYSSDIWKITWNNFELLNPNVISIVLLLMPFVTSIAITSVQLCLELISGTIVGYFATSMLLIISVYWDNPIMLGNYSMMLRNGYLGEGVHPIMSVFVCAIVTYSSYKTMVWHLSKRDILQRFN